MTYTKNTWVTGDTVTAQKLNNMEDGIEAANSGVMMVGISNQSGWDPGSLQYVNTLDKTFAEIYAALKDGTLVYIKKLWETDGPPDDYASAAALLPVVSAFKYADVYRVHVLSHVDAYYSGIGVNFIQRPCLVVFTANSVSAYPTATYCVASKDDATVDVYN